LIEPIKPVHFCAAAG